MIDLASDTATRPGKGMLTAMTAAPLGDEQRGEDPTTTALCERVADLLGMEMAVFLPSGTVLAGNAGFIEAAWHWKHRLGGAMRQSGILAAAGLYALDNNLDALARDHDNARMIAAILSEVPGLQVEPTPVETNILLVDVAETGLRTDAISAGLAPLGIRFYPDTATRLRIVTHLDVSRDQARTAARALAEYCLNADR